MATLPTVEGNVIKCVGGKARCRVHQDRYLAERFRSHVDQLRCQLRLRQVYRPDRTTAAPALDLSQEFLSRTCRPVVVNKDTRSRIGQTQCN